MFVNKGVELLKRQFSDPEANIADGFQFLSPSEIAVETGWSKGQIYYLWGGGREAYGKYILDVLRQLLDEANQGFAAIAAAVTSVAGMAPVEIIEMLANVEMMRLTNVAASSVRAGHCLIAHATSPAAQEVFCKAENEALDLMAGVYEQIAPMVGRCARPGVSYRDIAAAFAALSSGFASGVLGGSPMTPPISWASALDPSGEPRQWTIFTISVEALVLHLTERVE